jgi:tetratricopeptide (TPR) repeat protein
VLLSEGDRAGALSRYQRSLEIWERLSAADPASVDLARGATVPLERIGDVLLSEGNPAGALSRYQRSLEIMERLSAADPASEDRALAVSTLLNFIGNMLLGQGDRDGAVAHNQRSLEIAERLAAAYPASADRARGVFVSNWRLAQITGERRYWEQALAILRDLEGRGAILASDETLIAHIEGILAGPGWSPKDGRARL